MVSIIPAHATARKAGRDTAANNLTGHLAAFHNHAHPQWWRDSGLRKLHACILLVIFSSIVDGYDASLINNLQALPTWKSSLGNPSASMLGLFGCMQVVGAFLMSLPMAYIMDNWGRRLTLALGGLVCVIGGLIQAFSFSQGQYIVGRILVGCSQSFQLIGGNIMISELAHPRIRYKIVGFYQITWYIGSFFASWFCYGLRIAKGDNAWLNWRVPTLMMAVWGVIIMIFYFPMPESPRFLLAKGREDEARAFFLKYHANGAAADELVEAEIAEIKLALEIDRTVLKKSWREIWRNPGDRWRFFCSAGLSCCSLWSGQQIVSYYNTQILNQAGITEVLQQLAINAGLSVWDLCCAVLGALLSGRVGRRPMFLISYTGQLITCAILIAMSAMYFKTKIQGYGYATIGFFWLNSGFWNSSMNPIVYAYNAEIHTYATRAKGVSVYWGGVEIQAIVNRYINPVGIANLGYKFYFVYLAFYFFELAFMWWFLPETRGRSLEEIAEIFDGVPIAPVDAEADKAEIEHEEHPEPGFRVETLQ